MNTRTKLITGALIAIVALPALAGCSSAAPTPAVNPNAAACAGLTTATADVGHVLIDNDPSITAEQRLSRESAFAGSFDSLSLSATGEVATRLEEVSKSIPSPASGLGRDATAYFEAVAATVRACDAEGFHVNTTTWK